MTFCLKCGSRLLPRISTYIADCLICGESFPAVRYYRQLNIRLEEFNPLSGTLWLNEKDFINYDSQRTDHIEDSRT